MRRLAPPEMLSGSMRGRKPRVHARISTDSPKCAEIEGLDGVRDGYEPVALFRLFIGKIVRAFGSLFTLV